MNTSSRRRFVKSAALASLALANLRWAPALHAAQKSGLKLGIQLYSLRGYKEASVALKHAKDLGLSKWSFTAASSRWTPRQKRSRPSRKKWPTWDDHFSPRR